MSPVRLSDSASGIRPVAAFVVIFSVLAVVAGKVGAVALGEGPAAGPRVQVEQDAAPAYAVTDREGRMLAHFVQRLDLVASPHALWQAHTPEILCRALSESLGGRPSALELFRRLTPGADEHDVLRTKRRYGTQAAVRIDAWLRHGAFDPSEPAQAIVGMWLEPAGEDLYLLAWKPVVALSAKSRDAHFEVARASALRWTARLTDGLLRAELGEQAYEELEDDSEALLERRQELWSDLMPSTWCVALRGFETVRAPQLARVLSDQRVAWHQLHVSRDRDRSYPAGWHPLFGRWGYQDPLAAKRRVLGELGVDVSTRLSEEACEQAVRELDASEQALYRDSLEVALSEPTPLTGLERAWNRVLASEEFRWVQARPAAYAFERHRPALQPARSYFLDALPADQVPSARTTLDLSLQHVLGRELERTLEEQDAALAMGIVVDLATRDVLAVDSRERYEISGFAPVSHAFTPGSTFKVVSMACALDQGLVRADEVFDVGDGVSYDFHGRSIHEAENSPGGLLTAAQCLAFSANAGLVQIGTRVEDQVLRAYLAKLNYARAPQTGLGGERAGLLPKLPWKLAWAHASITYGHELQTTLWQHASALCSLLDSGGDSGVCRPLRLLDGVRQGARAERLPESQGARVVRPETSQILREMMALGAREGTGKPVAGYDVMPDLIVGTKTGTAQKVPTEVCLHVELAHQVRHRKDQSSCSRACRSELLHQRPGHRQCYTSSICMWGRTHTSEREVLVLIVVEEPRAKMKYGSRVAGPAAAKVLREALGVTSLGEPLVTATAGGFLPRRLPATGDAASSAGAAEETELHEAEQPANWALTPWAEVAR